MAKETYRSWSPTGKSKQIVESCAQILHELSQYRLTLRQLYYQLVTRNILVNSKRSYQNLSRLVTRARMAGLIDWSSIEDRVRQPWSMPEFSGLKELTDAALHSYRLPRWKDQDHYVELWVEKDALASVLRPLASQYHVTLMVNRGYSSASAMKAAADRFAEHAEPGILLYLGDFDPSGEDMVRDIRDRLYEFGVTPEVQKIALTWDQIELYEPPPNPARLDDPRAAEFVAKHGGSSWEVDALDPHVLEELISGAIANQVDMEIMDKIIEQEERDKQKLTKIVKELD